jgi:hypothetical protein
MRKPASFTLSRTLFSVAAASLLVTTAPSRADDSDVVHWQTVIGIMQAGNLVGSGTGQVAGGGQPWSATGGETGVNLRNGDVGFRVRGLVLAGGNGVGTRAAITEVKGTLVCDADGNASGGNSTLVDTPAVSLSDTGDAHFSGNLGPLPAACSEPDLAFLIRIAVNGPANGRWIANGAVLKRSGND